MRSMRSAQRQVELRRLDNQLPVLGKANSLRKIVKMLCVLPLPHIPGRVGPRMDKDIPSYRSSDKIRLASRRCTTVPLRPLVVEKILTPTF